MKQESEFTVKSRQNEVSSTAVVSQQIPVSGKSISSSSFTVVGLEELKHDCYAALGEDFHYSQPAVPSDRGCTKLTRAHKGGFSFKMSDAFSDKNFLRC